MTSGTLISRVAPLGREIEEVAQRLRRSVVSIQNGSGGGGAGVIWSSGSGESVIITNDHVVRGDEATIVLPTGERTTGTIAGRDRENDLAALRVARVGLPAVQIGDSRGLRVGQLVLALGHPFGVEHALTLGIVSALPRADELRELLRADLMLNPGNSGGPLTDAMGRVIGINAMVASPGVALSVPSQLVRAFLARELGPTPWLGVVAQPVPLPVDYLARFGLAGPVGLLITGVEIDSPADRAGLLPGDLVVGIGDRAVWQPRNLQEEIALAGVGARLALTIVRAGRRDEISVNLASRGAPATAERPAA